MVVDRGWDPRMFLEPVPKGSARFSYIFFRTIYVWAFKSIYYSTLLKFGVPALGAMRRVFMVLIPFKCTWIPKLSMSF